MRLPTHAFAQNQYRSGPMPGVNREKPSDKESVRRPKRGRSFNASRSSPGAPYMPGITDNLSYTNQSVGSKSRRLQRPLWRPYSTCIVKEWRHEGI